MIKLVASDMDGTLLPDNKVLDKEIYELIGEMRRQGVTFVAASGRQYHSLYQLFAPVAEDIYFIADNGAMVVHREAVLQDSVMSPALVQEILEELLTFQEHPIMLCGKQSAYANTKRQRDYLRSNAFQFQVRYVEDLSSVQDDILKISFIEEKDPYHTLTEMRRRFDRRCAVTFSGYDCIDFMNKGVDKGLALRALQKKLGVSREETLVFGDNYNDLEMMAEAGISCAMRHSPSGVKKAATKVLGSNNDGAVLEELRTIFLKSLQ